MKGLIFVSRKDEAHALAEKLTLNHVPSIALTGEDSPQKEKKQFQNYDLVKLTILLL